MSSLLRSLRKRLRANPPPVKPKGKLYAGDVVSISIGGREFPPMLEFADGHRYRVSGERERSFIVFKGRGTGATVGVLEQLSPEAPGAFEPSGKRQDWATDPRDIIGDIRSAAEKMRADHLRGPRPMSPYERAEYEKWRERLLAAIPKERADT